MLQLCDLTILLLFILKLIHYGLFSLIHSSEYRSRLSLVDKLGWGTRCNFFSLYTKWTNNKHLMTGPKQGFQ